MKAKDELQGIIEQISCDESPVGMDAVYVHALILDRLTTLRIASKRSRRSWQRTRWLKQPGPGP